MSFNPHKGLSRLINILFWTTITGAIIALLASIWSFLVISTNLKSFGTSVLMIIGVVILAILVKFSILYIVNGFFDKN